MAATASLSAIREGGLSVELRARAGAKPGETGGYFNDKMHLNRDLMVLGLAAHLLRLRGHLDGVAKRGCGPGGSARCLDAFAAAGIAGLRCAVEAPRLAGGWLARRGLAADLPRLCTTLNDLSAAAAAVAQANVDQLVGAGAAARCTCRDEPIAADDDDSDSDSGAPHVRTQLGRADVLLHSAAFDCVVLDPFGSVVPHLDSAMASAPHGGLLALTATDISTLYAAYPDVARRVYAAEVGPPRHPCFREFGARLLLAAAARAAGRHGRGIAVLVVVSREHFVHAQLLVHKGARASSRTAAAVNPVVHCTRCGDTAVGWTASCSGSGCTREQLRLLGPVWTGELGDAATARAMADMAEQPPGSDWCLPDARTLLRLAVDEADVGPVLFTCRPQQVAREAGVEAGRTDQVVRLLRARGHRASRTHFDQSAIRTTAPRHEFVAAVAAAGHAEQWRKI